MADCAAAPALFFANKVVPFGAAHLPSEHRTKATIKVKNGPLYTAHEIEHLRYGA